MNYPDLGLNVIAVLEDGEEKIGYWNGDVWMQGVENNPIDIPIEENVVSWRPWP
jgi:hypothetical protein